MEIRNALTFVIEIDRIESTGINTVVTRQKTELRDRIQEDRTQNRIKKTEPTRSLETEELRWREHAGGSWRGTGLGA